MNYIKKIFTLTLLLTVVFSPAMGETGSDGRDFPFHSSEIIKSVVDTNNGCGSAILSDGRLLSYKQWATEEASAFEAMMIDINKIADKKKNWFSDEYIEEMILWMSKLVMNKTDNQVVLKTFREKKFMKSILPNGDIIYKILGTNYSEFYFAVRPPGDYIDSAIIKVRYVLTL